MNLKTLEDKWADAEFDLERTCTVGPENTGIKQVFVQLPQPTESK